MSQIFYDVPLIPQQSTNSCWYAAARMITEYHRNRRQQTTLAGGLVGQPAANVQVASQNSLLQPSVVENFARLCNLRMTYLSPSPQGLIQLLTNYGPLWYGGVVNGYRGFQGGGHVVVITGCLYNGAGAQVAINDPWPVNQGARLYEIFDEFFQHLAARDARVPILHF